VGTPPPPSPANPSRPKIRPSKATRWRATALIAIHALVAIHVAHWLSNGKTLSPLEPSEAGRFCERGLVNAGLIFFALTILSTLVLGRWFCGWACHVVALQDLSRGLLRKIGITPRPLRSRALAVVPFLAFAFMFLLPLWDRVHATHSAGATEVRLETEKFWATFPSWPVAVFTFVTCGFVIVYFLGAKGFCTYGCPYGAIFGTVDRLAPGRIRVTDDCRGCAHCTAVCTSNVRVHEEVARFGMVVDSGCMKCLDCVSVCPNDALYFGFGKPAIAARARAEVKSPRRELRWWDEALLAGFFLLAFFTVHGLSEGLYDVFPFLVSLGFSAILAYLSTQLVRLAYAPNVSIVRFPLKVNGRLGWRAAAFAVVMAGVAALWIHSGLVGWHGWRRTRIYVESGDISANLPALLQSPVTLSGDQRRLVDDGIRHADFVDRHGLLYDGTNAIHLAWFRFLEGDDAEGERVLVRYLRETPQNATWRRGYALFLRSRGRVDEAIAALREAIRTDPKLVEAHVDLAQTLAGAGRADEARKVLDDALAAGLEAPPILFAAGAMRADRGDLDGAIALLERCFAAAPGSVPACRMLSQLHAAAGHADLAREWSEKARAIESSRR
jgi:NAD-dependent dihydropyrimidine dehydrogenase PreA subunit